MKVPARVSGAAQRVTDLGAIDWRAPWLADWSAVGEPAARHALASGDVAGALNAAESAPVRFVPQAELPEGVAYEAHIHATGGVPTRDGLHDFFNGLCWMRFPQTKRRLNVLQAEAIRAAGGVGATRGPLRDALTLFDENVALLHAPEALWQALRAREWSRLFVALRPLWAEARLVLFGHALQEKLVQPYKSITAHVLCLPMPVDAAEGTPHAWDSWLAERLTPEWLAAKPYTPLPVLGVPGWWPANGAEGFYDDTDVFRPARLRA